MAPSSGMHTFLPSDQILLESGYARKILKGYHTIGVEGDVIASNTIFDQQAALGKFSTTELKDLRGRKLYDVHYSQIDQKTQQHSLDTRSFTSKLRQCMILRDVYQEASGQRSIDNPLFGNDWISYPPQQPKGWHYEDEYGTSDYYYDMSYPHYYGEIFDIEHYYQTLLKPLVEGLDTTSKVTTNKNHILEVKDFKHKVQVPSFGQFFRDMNYVIDTSTDQTGTVLSSKRLGYLNAKFDSYVLLNEFKENTTAKLNPHRDFYNVRKIDNNIDLTMAMSKKHLLNVINLKLKEEPDRVVYDEDGVKLTLKQLFEPYFEDLEDKRFNIDDLFEFGLVDRNFGNNKLITNSSTDYESFIKNEVLLKIDKTFLRIENAIDGEYLSLIIKQVLSDYEKSKYQFGEMGINFNLSALSHRSGSTKWESISKWIIDNKLVSHNVKWIIRIPRNYSFIRREGHVKSFKDYLDHLFKNLFEVSINPESNVKLHFFLTKVSAFDLLSGVQTNDDESLFKVSKLSSPLKWTSDENPPYCYYLYYIFANLSKLNEYRRSRGFNTFNLRPHTASVTTKSGLGIITESLASNFLLAKNIINGEKLVDYPVLQYLYYLKQIGISMSPLSWNKRVQLLNEDDRDIEVNGSPYEANPYFDFFKIGLKVSLCTSKPLFSSLTREPLIEEYSIGAAIHKLNSVDLCELCRNSVLISEFNGALKRHWIGIEYNNDSLIDYNEIDDFSVQRTNVPKMRTDYRKDTLLLEHEIIKVIESNTE